MLYVFDLDGTLVDSRRAVREAYRAAGVIVPATAWGRPVGGWCTASQHAVKNAVYEQYLREHGTKLPLYALAQRLKAPVLTAASDGAVEAVQAVFGPLNIAGTGMTIQQKLKFINAYAWAGVYVDDDPSARRRVMEESGWSSISPKACQRSFSLRALTPGSPA